MTKKMEMFLKNKYTKWYFRIIENSRLKNHADYIENHHIIPKCMGGDNSSENLIKLTAKEHYICHLLLVKSVVPEYKKKMNYAFWRMCNTHNKRYKPSARMYELGKQGFIEAHIGHESYMISQTTESREKIGKSMSAILSKLTETEMKERMSNSCCHPDVYTEERAKNISKATTGKKKTKTEKLLRAETDRKNRTPQQKLLCGAHNKNKTWKIIDGKRTWIAKEVRNY
jgi:hypothetical protein